MEEILRQVGGDARVRLFEAVSMPTGFQCLPRLIDLTAWSVKNRTPSLLLLDRAP
jgi:hypothetical protein